MVQYGLVVHLFIVLCCVVCAGTRIDWAATYAHSYFSAAGTLRRLLDKDERSRQFHADTSADTSADSSSSLEGTRESAALRCCGSEFKLSGDLEIHRAEMRELLNTRLRLTSVWVVLLWVTLIVTHGWEFVVFKIFRDFTKSPNVETYYSDITSQYLITC